MESDFSNILKKCSKCGNELPLTEFHKAPKGKYGVRSVCKSCRASENVLNRDSIKAYNKKYTSEHKENILKQKRLYDKRVRAENAKINHLIDPTSYKTCGRCGERKLVIEFSKNRSNPDGLQFRCKQCVSKHYSETKDIVILRAKRWKENHRDYANQLRRERYADHNSRAYITNKKYYEINKSTILIKQREYHIANIEYCRRRQALHYQMHKEYYRALNYRRKHLLGYAPLNKHFEGAEYHHLHFDLEGNPDKAIGVYVPKELHRSVWHNGKTGYNMDVINKLALEWYESNKSVIVSD